MVVVVEFTVENREFTVRPKETLLGSVMRANGLHVMKSVHGAIAFGYRAATWNAFTFLTISGSSKIIVKS